MNAKTSLGVVSRRLQDALTRHHSHRVVVAYSGGIDSTVLLHCLTHADLTTTDLLAVYVNHHWHPDSGQWAQACERQARAWGCDFLSVSVKISDTAREGREAAARTARYRALQSCMNDGDLLVTAHHADDQAETVLLQLMRGAGPRGLAAMPELKAMPPGYLIRPMLDVPRSTLEAYAHEHNLRWIDDPANDDLSLDRNYVRQSLGAVLSERWPQWSTNLTRAASHQREVLERMKYDGERLLGRHQGTDATLDISSCLCLSHPDKKLLLRHWLDVHGLTSPSARQIDHLIGLFLADVSTAGGVVSWQGGQVRRYRGRLYAMPPLPEPPAAMERVWLPDTDMELPEINQTLSWQGLIAQAPECAGASELIVRLRKGGERYVRGTMHRPLKKLFQELGVPPWLRNRTPLIYVNEELRVVWNLTVCG